MKNFKIKFKLLTLTCLFFSALQVNAAQIGISVPGYYYQAYHVGNSQSNFTVFLIGPFTGFNGSNDCNADRSAQYGNNNGTLPWEGGPGACFYIAENNIDNYNNIYSSALDPGTNPIINFDAEEMVDYFQQLDEINQEHDIANYKLKVINLIESFNQPHR